MDGLCTLLAAVLASAGVGGRDLETTIQDDAQFLHRPPAAVQAAARRVAELGADRVRLTASWSALAPAPRARRRPDFDATDPRAYPAGAFHGLDTAVKAVTAAGLQPQVDLAFWAPRWAVRLPSSNPDRERRYVDAEAFADFATAVGRRYRGDFPDPDGRGHLPAVRLWTTWNEPNHPSFLAPQWVREGATRKGRRRARKRGRLRPMSPHVYRAMHQAAQAALKRVSFHHRVLVGGTASSGAAPGKGGVPPLRFVRELACVDAALRPLAVPECRDFEPLRADGFAHHPYQRYAPPGTPAAGPDDVPLADVGRLHELLEALRAQGRIASAAPLPLELTEFGYETREDDPYQPFSRDDQATFLGHAAFLAQRHPAVASFAQFLLRDVDPKESGRPPGSRGSFRDWQSGIYDHEGRPKPAARAFKAPFWAQREGEGVALFGHVRPARGPVVARVEREDPATGAWVPVPTQGDGACDQEATFATAAGGTFLRTAPAAVAGARLRFSWRHGDGSWEQSAPVAVP